MRGVRLAGASLGEGVDWVACLLARAITAVQSPGLTGNSRLRIR